MLEVTSENVKELLASDKPLVLDFLGGMVCAVSCDKPCYRKTVS